MNRLVSKISFIFLSTTMLFAVDSTAVDSGSNISTLVEQIKSAKTEDRRALINQLKIKLRGLNQDIRQKTMMELRSSFAKNGMHHQYRKHTNSSINNQEKSENLQHARQQSGIKNGNHNGQMPDKNNRPNKNNGQQNKGH
jgi:hypothetical protein